MTLTRRRMDFLEVLRDLVSAARQPVHYDRVGERLKVSKWTAYDMLKELTSDGLVRSSYSTSKSAFRGRSQVLFEPTASGLALLGEMANTETDTRHRNAESGYASVLERAKAAAEPKPDLHEFLAGLKDASPLAFCASLIGALVGEFKRRGLGASRDGGDLVGDSQDLDRHSVRIDPAKLHELGIRAVPLTLHFGEESYLDGFELRGKALWDKMRESSEIPRSSQLPVPLGRRRLESSQPCTFLPSFLERTEPNISKEDEAPGRMLRKTGIRRLTLSKGG